MTFLTLVAGLVLLLVSGEFLVRGGVSLAGHFKISRLVVGLTVVSLGTSSPELVVSLDAAISGHPDISVGNVIGSNISNIALVLALTILITPYFVNTRSIVRDWIIMMAVSVLFVLFMLDMKLSRMEGIILFMLLIAYIWLSIRRSRKDMKSGNGNYPPARFALPVAIVIIIVSCLGLVLGADLLVKGASSIARMLGVSERIISVSVVALGTSLPELATSAVAAARKENDISIGNILGSNIFNILAILGITAGISPFSINDPDFNFDIIWMLAISFLIFILILPLKGSMLRRWKGILLMFSYLTYIYILFFAG